MFSRNTHKYLKTKILHVWASTDDFCVCNVAVEVANGNKLLTVVSPVFSEYLKYNAK